MENNGSDLAPASASASAPLKKDRHVVTWSPQEDELLREQIAVHGTNNWTIISANFKDKTSRQCRRRWYTYLNSEFKKGGWSPEEDMLLCEAQKILGNKWTEIAKVVSGRTDNAVKNRFSTLCKKRAKDEALYNENIPFPNTNNNTALIIKNRLISAGIAESSVPFKQRRYDIPNSCEKIGTGNKLLVRELTSRQPLSEISQNTTNLKAPLLYNVSGTDSKGTFLKRDDPKLATLFQQAELLSSLAVKVNTENSKERFDEAWKQLQEYLNRREGKGTQEEELCDVTSLLDDLKDLIEDLRGSTSSNNEENSLIDLESQLDLQMDASRSVEDHDLENFKVPDDFIDVNNEAGPSIQISENLEPDSNFHSPTQKFGTGFEAGPSMQICENLEPDSNFHSPTQKFHAFQSADSIPSPKFSESERKFLLTVLGMASPGSNFECSKQPTCKRALL